MSLGRFYKFGAIVVILVVVGFVFIYSRNKGTNSDDKINLALRIGLSEKELHAAWGEPASIVTSGDYKIMYYFTDSRKSGINGYVIRLKNGAVQNWEPIYQKTINH